MLARHCLLQAVTGVAKNDSRVRRQLALHANSLKEDLLKTRSDLRNHRRTTREQQFKIGMAISVLSPFGGLAVFASRLPV